MFKLHLGCYDQPVQGWMNTDVTRQILISRIPFGPVMARRMRKISDQQVEEHRRGLWNQVTFLDVGKRFPFSSGSVDAVFSCHLLEHLPPRTRDNMLAECARVMKPNSIFRVIVPDLDALVSGYDRNNPNLTIEKIFELNMRNKDRHWWMFNEVNLRAELSRFGFINIRRESFRRGRCPDVEVIDRRPVGSLFVEAESPGQ